VDRAARIGYEAYARQAEADYASTAADAKWPAEMTMRSWDGLPPNLQAAWEAAASMIAEDAAAERAASARLVREILVALCNRDGLSLESDAEPGEPARNYELALRLGIGPVFGLGDSHG